MIGDAARAFTRAFVDLRFCASRLLLAGLVYKLLAFVVLVPIVTTLLRGFVGFSGSDVLADQDIALFVLSPFGILALIVVGAVSLAYTVSVSPT